MLERRDYRHSPTARAWGTFELIGWWRLARVESRATVVALILAMLTGVPAMSTTPANPERPMNARTCEEARTRLREAERGSSLISRKQNREIVAKARAQVERLCGS